MCSQDVFCLGEPETSEEYLEADEPEIFTRPYLYHWGESLWFTVMAKLLTRVEWKTRERLLQHRPAASAPAPNIPPKVCAAPAKKAGLPCCCSTQPHTNAQLVATDCDAWATWGWCCVHTYPDLTRGKYPAARNSGSFPSHKPQLVCLPKPFSLKE